MDSDIPAPVRPLSAAETPLYRVATPPNSRVYASRGARRDTLSPVIEAAQKLSVDPWDAADVWSHLLAMAARRNLPLLGCTESGIQYLRGDGEAASLSRNAFGKRLRRAAALEIVAIKGR